MVSLKEMKAILMHLIQDTAQHQYLAGLGLVKARDLKNEHYSVVSVIGDGALTGGMAYEALNNASSLKTNFIIVLNDNTMSIAKNVGGVPHMLSNIRSSD